MLHKFEFPNQTIYKQFTLQNTNVSKVYIFNFLFFIIINLNIYNLICDVYSLIFLILTIIVFYFLL
jgi:hypothetical protein